MLHQLAGKYPLGLKPRKFRCGVPHFSALRYRLTVPDAPKSLDYTVGMPSNIGMFLNDRLGCCAEAGYFHGVQTWTYNATGSMLTVPDNTVQQLYADGAGYVPGNPATDQGTDLQSLLTYLVNTGALMPDGTRHKILGFVEIDPRNLSDVNLATAECGIIYTGWSVPQFIEDLGLEAPGSLWDVHPEANNTIVGGHCTVSAKYGTDNTRGEDSWGSDEYQMTQAFWLQNVTEAYAIVDPLFMKATGRTPFGMTEADWEQQMQAIKQAA